MKWSKRFAYQSIFKWANRNQHGDRYTHDGSNKLSVCKMSAESDNLNDMKRLVLMSHHLDCPVRFDFEDHTAYIEVVAKEKLK